MKSPSVQVTEVLMNPQTPSPPGSPDLKLHDEFMRLYSQAYLSVYSFILTLVPVVSDADDIMQQTSMVLWQKFSQFETGSSFVHWAQQIARFEVLTHRRTRARDRHVFSDEMVQLLAADYDPDNPRMENERIALVECLKRMTHEDRELLQRCYSGEGELKVIAEKVSRTPTSLYKWLNRVREALLQCVSHRSMEAHRA